MESEHTFVGETVHYVSYGTPGGEYQSVCRAAIVTEIPDAVSQGPNVSTEERIPDVSLCVLNPKGTFFDLEVSYAEPAAQQGGTWHFTCDEH